MMQQSDGSIIIDTQINTDGAGVGGRKLQKELGRVIDNAEKAADKVKKAFAKAGAFTYDPQAMEKVFGKTAAQNIKNYVDAIELYGKQAGQVLNKLDSSLQDQTNDYKREIESLSKALKDMEQDGMYFGDEDYDNTYIKLQKVTQALKDYKKELVSPAATPKVVDVSTMSGKIGQLSKELLHLEDKGKGFGDSEYDATAVALKRAQEALAAYKSELFKTDEQRQKEAKSVRKQQEAQEKLNQKLQEAKEKEAAAAAESERLREIGENAKVSNAHIVKLRQELEALENRQKDLQKAGVGVGYKEYNRNAAKIRNLRAQINAYASDTKKASKSTKQMKTSVDQGGKSAKKFGSNMAGLLKRLILFRILRTAIFTAFRSAREGMENIAQYSPETNKAISNVLSSLTQLKNSFATSFSPIAEYASPALVEFISLLSEAVTWTSQFFAALTGKDTYTKATKVEEDYGAALKESNKQIKAQEKANKKLTYSFDELIQAGNKSDQDKTGYVGPTPDQMFTTEEVSNDIKARADAVKEIFSGLFAPLKESWLDNGPEVMQSLTNLFTSAKQLAQDVGASFMQVWNVEGYGKTITDNLLITFANLAQTVANLITQFDKAWVSGDTGTKILRHLGDILVTLSGFFRSASESIKNWAANLDFSPLLKSFDKVLTSVNPVVRAIGNLLLWLLNNVLLPITKWGLEQALPSVFELIAAALDTLCAVIEALEPVGEWLWNSFLQPIGEWTGEIIINALKLLTDVLKKFSDWISENKELVRTITYAILGFFAAWTIIKLVSDIGKLFVALKGFISVMGKVLDSITPVKLALWAIITLAAILYDSWDKMTPTERMISFLLAAASAAGILAVALGAISGAAGALAMGASIAAGIGSAMIAINAGKRQTQSTYSNAGGGRYAKYASAAATYNMPRLATGTVVPPRAGEFAAILGDNKRETEVVSPLSTIKQALKEALAESGGSRDITVIMEVDGRRFGQAVYKANNEEKQRVGVRMVTV